MTACHLIADCNLSLLCNVDTNCLIYSRRQLIAVLAGKYLCIYNDTIFTVRYLQGSITHLTCFLTKDCSQQTLLCRQLSLTLRCNLADQDITGTYFCTDTDDTSLIQILQCIVADARNITGDLFRSQLRVTCFCLIFFHMNRRVNVIHNQLLAQKNRILVVIAFPGHKSDQRVLSKCDLAV